MALLYKVDVSKSRQECVAFTAAEEGREAFTGSHFDAPVAERSAGAKADRV